jgi:hypothetical protein
MLVIFAEEPSMKIFLETLIQRVYPDLQLTVKAYRGKQDLEKGVPRFLRAWKVPDTRFIVVHDQDSWDCVDLKKKLTEICDFEKSGVAIRIACHELESWYWGDIAAVEAAFNKHGLVRLTQQRNYRVSDNIMNPKKELKRYLPQYEQIAGARAIAEHFDIEHNTSHSFQVFISKVGEFARYNA